MSCPQFNATAFITASAQTGVGLHPVRRMKLAEHPAATLSDWLGPTARAAVRKPGGQLETAH
jgi:hypothetical protein